LRNSTITRRSGCNIALGGIDAAADPTLAGSIAICREGFSCFSSDVWSCCGADRARFYYFFMIVVVIRYKTKATARRALTFTVRIFVNDTIAIAIWAGFHVSVPRSRAQLDEAAHIINPTLCKPATRSSKGQQNAPLVVPVARSSCGPRLNQRPYPLDDCSCVVGRLGRIQLRQINGFEERCH